MVRTRQPKIVVVDDSRVARAIVRKGFERAGYEVFDTDEMSSALRLICEQRPDALLLDLYMPNLPTFDFIEQVDGLRRTRGSTMKILLYTAAEPGALARGVDGCITKSEGIADCVAAVEAHIANLASD